MAQLKSFDPDWAISVKESEDLEAVALGHIATLDTFIDGLYHLDYPTFKKGEDPPEVVAPYATRFGASVREQPKSTQSYPDLIIDRLVLREGIFHNISVEQKTNTRGNEPVWNGHLPSPGELFVHITPERSIPFLGDHFRGHEERAGLLAYDANTKAMAKKYNAGLSGDFKYYPRKAIQTKVKVKSFDSPQHRKTIREHFLRHIYKP